MGNRRCRILLCPPVLLFILSACSSPVAASLSNRTPSALRVYAVSSAATPTATPIPPVAVLPVPTASPVPTPTLTPGPMAVVVDFTFNGKQVTLHVGQRMRLQLSAGPQGDWISGVADTRVLAPVSPAANGVYQAVAVGTTLVTAHVLIGCANVSPAAPCDPNRGLWFQMRAVVVP
ncbi:MAG: hypothetical protein ACYDAG_02015 [Chloroflexota bacterium]